MEPDIRLTKDDELVLIHNRIANGSGAVEKLTLQELRRLDAGLGCQIPTLLKFLDLIRDLPRMTVDIELKEYPH